MRRNDLLLTFVAAAVSVIAVTGERGWHLLGIALFLSSFVVVAELAWRRRGA